MVTQISHTDNTNAVLPLIEKIVNGYNKYFNTKGKKILLHLAFWLLYFVYYLFSVKAIYSMPWFGTIIFAFRNIIISASIFYLILYLFVPYLLLKKKYFFFIISCIFVLWIINIINHFFLKSILAYSNIDDKETLDYIQFAINGKFLNAISIVGVIKFSLTFWSSAALPILLKLSFDLIKTIYSKTQVEKENLILEVNFLKAQLNPHFLFNALNNIYALTVKKDDKAPDTILILSEMMRYTLYETNMPQVSLQKEINFIRSYISLQKIRYEKSEVIQFTTTYQKSELETMKVAPLLLFNFVENTFKHGLNTMKENGWIRIDITFKNNTLYFFAANNFDEQYAFGLKKNNKNTGGIGVENTRKRLALLYPDKHFLQIKKEKNVYEVSLKIEL